MVRFAKDVGFAISFLPIELLPDKDAGARNWEGRFIRYRPEMGLHTEDSGQTIRARIDWAYDQLVAMKKDGWPSSTPPPIWSRAGTTSRRAASPQKVVMQAACTFQWHPMASTPSATGRCSNICIFSMITSKIISDPPSTSGPECWRLAVVKGACGHAGSTHRTCLEHCKGSWKQPS